LLDRSNVRIDALYLLLPRRVRAVLDLVAILALAVFVFFVTKGAWSVFYGSLGWPLGENDIWSVSVTPLTTPLAIPQGLWLLGLLLFMFAIVLVLLRALTALVRGDLATVTSVAGSRSHEEEVSEELHLAELARGQRSAPHGREGR
jgi:TRAP-type C4-dicarboxylate transport system permease small subunit